jgi:hypothetical protein
MVYSKAGDFFDGVAEVSVVEDGVTSWGYIDRNGKFLWKGVKGSVRPKVDVKPSVPAVPKLEPGVLAVP